MNAEGGCACGALRYRLTSDPLIVHACHCRDCQRLTGSAYATNAWIEREFVELLKGTPTHYPRKAGSGQGHDVYFCAACGTTIWSHYHRTVGKFWFVRVGTLDEPALLSPDVHIYTRSKHPAVVLPPSARTFEATYDKEQVWPAASLARFHAALRAVGAGP